MKRSILVSLLPLLSLASGCVEVPPPGGGGSGGGGGASACSGSRGATGTTEHSLELDGLERTYLVHVPATLDPSKPAPIVFVHHGFTMSGEIMVGLTGFADVADREGFIAVFPDGEGAYPWNAGENTCAGGPVDHETDDIGFVEAMLDAIAAEHCVDRDAVFVTGFSMGGYFTNHIACQAGDMLRAVAPHSGGTYPGDCPGAPVPILILHGDAYWLVPPECGSDAHEYWVARNGCSAEVETVAVKGGHCERSQGCPEGGAVVYCSFEGMLHGWAGAPTFGPGTIYTGGDSYADATELIWEFFEEQL